MDILEGIKIFGLLGLASGIIFLLKKLFGTWISEEIKNIMKSRYNRKYNKIDSDRNLFKMIIDILPSNGSIFLIEENLIGIVSFNWDHLEQLEDFRKFSLQPQNKFHNHNLAKLHNELLHSITQYLSFLAKNTFRMNNVPNLSIVPKEWEFSQKALYTEVKKKLDQMSSQLVKNYNLLVNKSKKKLQL